MFVPEVTTTTAQKVTDPTPDTAGGVQIAETVDLSALATCVSMPVHPDTGWLVPLESASRDPAVAPLNNVAEPPASTRAPKPRNAPPPVA